MVGGVTIMQPADYETCLAGAGSSGTLAQQGERLFEQLGCSGCHLVDRQGRGPMLRGMYGSRVQLANGQTVQADDAYIRESILNPNAKLAAGFGPNVMPSFQGQISEEGILHLVVYIKSLAVTNAPGAPAASLQPALIARPVSVASRATQ